MTFARFLARSSLVVLAGAPVLLAWPGPAAADQAARRLSYAQAIETSLTGSPEVKAAGAGIGAAEARIGGARASRWPRLSVDANLYLWDKALKFDLGPNAPAGAGEAVIREQVTSAITLSVVQPISGLLLVNQLIGLEETGAAVARSELDRARLEASYRAASAYLALLGAVAVREIEEKGVTQIEGQLARAKVLEGGGTLGKVDVLRIEAALAVARQSALKAKSGVETGRDALALALGLPDGTAIDAFDDLADPPAPMPWSEEDAVARALAARPELVAAAQRVEQADGSRRAAVSQMLPNLSGVISYQHNEGVGTIQPENALYGGLTLRWDVWDWGKNWSAVKEGKARTQQAEIARAGLADQIAFEVRRRFSEAETAQKTLDVARTGLVAAEEAYRIQSVRFQQGAATTTDVLDAETEVARARSGAVMARYQYLTALVALARAVGETPAVIR